MMRTDRAPLVAPEKASARVLRVGRDGGHEQFPEGLAGSLPVAEGCECGNVCCILLLLSRMEVCSSAKQWQS